MPSKPTKTKKEKESEVQTAKKAEKTKKVVKTDKSEKVKKAVSSEFAFPPKETVAKILELLHKAHPDARVALTFEDPLELIVATILSAQCTDERVNKVTPVFFEKYKSAEDIAAADIEDIKEIIRSTGFFNQKAKFIKEMAMGLVQNFNGKVPETMAELLTLQGVARKTANVVLGGAFGKSEGIVVDTHVKRVSFRLGLTVQTNPEKIEKDLMEIIPTDEWVFIGNALVFHGRRFCNARKPNCPECPMNEICPSAFNF